MRFQFWREEREEESYSSWMYILIPAALIAAIFLLLPRIKQEDAEEEQSGLRKVATRQSRAVRDSREEEDRQSGLQRQHMRQDQVEQKEMKQTQAKERRPEKTAERAEAADKLEEIEGIGPKTAEVLRGHGITTFHQLADTPVERLYEIMDEAGFRINPPDTWPEQARFAADSDWEGLRKLKDRLKAGRPQ